MSQEYGFFVILMIIWSMLIILITMLFMVIELVLEYVKKDSDDDESLINKFYEKLNVVSTQTTKEILECLFEMKELDEIYNEIRERNCEFMDEISYLNLKENTLNNIITDKISKIKYKGKTEKLKSLLEEIKTCRERYPEYNEVFVAKTKQINKMIKK